MDVTYFASYREDTRGVTSRAIIKEQGIFTCGSLVSGRPCLIAWSRSPARCPLHDRRVKGAGPILGHDIPGRVLGRDSNGPAYSLVSAQRLNCAARQFCHATGGDSRKDLPLVFGLIFIADA